MTTVEGDDGWVFTSTGWRNLRSGATVPHGGSSGQFLTKKSDDDYDTAWTTLSKFKTAHTWVIGGDITSQQPPAFMVPVMPDQIVRWVAVWTMCTNDGECEVEVFVQGDVSSGVITVTTTAALVALPSPVVLANGDIFTAENHGPVSGSPQNLSIGVILEHQLT